MVRERAVGRLGREPRRSRSARPPWSRYPYVGRPPLPPSGTTRSGSTSSTSKSRCSSSSRRRAAVVLEPADQPVRREDRSGPGPTSRPGTSARSGDRPRRRPPRRTCAPSRSGGGRRRSAARRSASASWTRAIAAGSVTRHRRCTVPSSSVTSPHGSPSVAGASAAHAAAVGVAVEREDRREVRPRGPHQLAGGPPWPPDACARAGGSGPARSRSPARGQKKPCRVRAAAVGRGVGLRRAPTAPARRRGAGSPSICQRSKQLGGMAVGVLAHGEVDLDHVVRAARDQLGAQRGSITS